MGRAPPAHRSSRPPSSSEEASIAQDPLEQAGALLAQARTANEVGRFTDAAALLDEALGLLDPRSDVEARTLRTRVLITRSWSELETRGLEGALAMLREARAAGEALGDPVLVTLSHVQEGTVQGRVGNWSACLAALDQTGDGEEGLTAAQRCALHLNRGQAQLGVGDTAGAAASFELVRDLAAGLGYAEQEFKARHNRAVVAYVDGDLPGALLLMREADAMDVAVSRDRARLDQAEVLLEAGLVDGARSALEDALLGARSEGHRLEEGEINLRLARCDLLVDDLDGARRHVRAATAAYRTRQAEELVVEAELTRAVIDVAAGRDVPGVVTTLARLGERPGTRPAARREAARLEAEARLLLGDTDGAERRLASLDGAPDSLKGRLHEALVRARLDAARGRPAEAERRVVTGNRLLAAHQFQSSSLDVRAGLAVHGRRLATFDAERAVADGDPDGILTSVERWRAISHRINPVTAPRDPEITAATRELRRLRQLDGEGGGSGAAGDLAARIAALEDHVAQREWTLTVGAARAPTVLAADAEEVRAAAVERGFTVVEFFELGKDLWTIEVSDGRVQVHRTQPLADVVRLVTRLRRDLRARTILPRDSPMAPVLERATTASLAALDTALNPGGPADRRVVIVPSGSLAGVPWSLLPSLHGRPVTVAPSATRWVRGPSRDGGRRWTAPVAALFGPGLVATAPEIAAIRAAWASAFESGSRPASSDDVLEALRSARVVHLAAHGIHEAQSPLFSSVQAHDGPVFAHEFPRPVAAEHVALSACDVGQFSTRPGDEPLGLAIALISLGATSVLAAVAPVADSVAAEAMVAYHRLLAAGADAATAWGQVVEQQPAAGVFCYYGSDWSVGEPVR